MWGDEKKAERGLHRVGSIEEVTNQDLSELGGQEKGEKGETERTGGKILGVSGAMLLLLIKAHYHRRKKRKKKGSSGQG